MEVEHMGGAVALREFLKSQADGDLLPWSAQGAAARRFGVSVAEVEGTALECSLLPMRYRRNRETLSVSDQLTLFRSRVAVIGCGGLGGYLVEETARLGIGALVLADPDVFEEHNLNRQLLSSPARLGQAKVEVARERVADVNPAVTVVAHRVAFSRENGARLLSGSSAVVDGLDNHLARRDLAAVCRELSIPFIHGAIAGWYGQVTTQLPGGDIAPLLEASSAQGKGVELSLGNPSFTPATVASLQVAELVKVLLGRGRPLSGQLLLVNLLDMEFEKVSYR
jgi:molybdopterin/thiamine biosynthesis adenylyltransferase